MIPTFSNDIVCVTYVRIAQQHTLDLNEHKEQKRIVQQQRGSYLTSRARCCGLIELGSIGLIGTNLTVSFIRHVQGVGVVAQ